MKTEKVKEFIRDGRAPIPKTLQISKTMSSIKAKNTKPEIIIRKELVRSNLIGYRIHNKKIPGRPDISYSNKRLAIFINGCFWHRCPRCKPPFPKTHKFFWFKKFYKNIKRDKMKRKQLNNLGWSVITLWECEINENTKKCVEVIKTYLEQEMEKN